MAQITPVIINRSAERESLLRARMSDADQRRAVEIVLAMFEAERNVDAQQFVVSKADQLKADLRQHAARDLAEEIMRLRADAAQTTADDVETREEKRRDALNEPLDLVRLDRATNAAEVSSMLRDAETDGIEVLRRAWGYAQPKLRAMALAEQRAHRLPSGTSAFAALTIWQTKMAAMGRNHPDAETLEALGDHRQRDVEQKVVEVAAIAGLRNAVLAMVRWGR